MGNGESSDKKLFAWLNFERFLSIAVVLLAVGGMLATVNSLDRRVSSLENRTDAMKETLGEVRGDVKLLLERTKSRGAGGGE